ncbi:hypothetical protein NEMIN01_1928 [Nematocida minor]|uniref:uncharacterized protein n=1 Tax=Nematocida minor TaxID=1912983 RepID=UPI00221F8006|nr:uncharacterized protein NEMIN01_1928 [Nematocida minor]KAI5192299.1 hypothetical protein NEMIN01_1928 [Nematocida minor]
MKAVLLFVFLLFLQNSSQNFSELETYSSRDLKSTEPMMIFIYYDSPGSSCLACESYKKWLGSFSGGTVGVFKIKTINFNIDPLLALRFKATSFPTFFLQHRNRFKNITAVDIFDYNISYDKKYENDIDAILKNPKILDNVETREGIYAPSSKLLLVYAYCFTWAMITISILDRIAEAVPLSVIMFGLCIIAIVSFFIKRKHHDGKVKKE